MASLYLLPCLGPPSRHAEAFVARHARTILGGGAEQVATALDKAARTARLKKNRRKGIDDAIGYLRNKWEDGRCCSPLLFCLVPLAACTVVVATGR